MDQTTSNTSASLESRSRASLRRPKPQLSCRLCRAKKLKCDREHPCKNCSKLPPGSCVYVVAPVGVEKPGGAGSSSAGQSARRSQSGTSTKIQTRIQRLEQLVASLAEASGSVGQIEHIDGDSSRATLDGGGRPVPSVEDQIAEPMPHLTLQDPEPRFFSSSHWEAILSDIACIKDELVANRTSIIDDESDPYTNLDEPMVGPLIFFSGHRDISADELICSVPPRSVVEPLVTMLLEGADIPPLLTMLHVPSFLDECSAYWEDPQAVSLPWLSLLFGVLSLALQLVVRSNLRIDGVLLPESAARTYTARAAQCLIASDYARPTKYTVEATLFYMACEHFWMEDGHFRASLVFGLGLRLALRLGYHRDPLYYPGICVFDAEMRRRTWAFMQQVDLMLAQKCGLPRQISYEQSDANPPSNTLDIDLWPEMTTAPQVRADSEMTPIGSMNYKNRLLEVVAQIIDRANSSTNTSYEEALELDRRLMRAAATRPAWLKPPTEGELVVEDSSYSGLHRWVDANLIIQRGRMILHRKFLVPAHHDPRYSSSREVCLAAAETALQDQRRMYDEACRHDRTKSSNSRFLSLFGHDFLLAAILICLDLDQCWRRHETPDATNVSQIKATKADFDRRVGLMRSSHEVWTSFLGSGPGARKAAKVLEIMIHKFHRDRGLPHPSLDTSGLPVPAVPRNFDGPEHLQDPVPPGFAAQTDLWAQQVYLDAQNGGDVAGLDGGVGGSNADSAALGYPTARSDSAAHSEDPFQGMLDDPLMQMDWTAWDSQFVGATLDFLE